MDVGAKEGNRLLRLAATLDEIVADRGRGRGISPETYREQLGEGFDEFVELVTEGDVFERVQVEGAAPPLPRSFGDYTLERELGRGAMGIVYEAVERRADRRVALKVLRPGVASTPKAMARFRREAEALRRVDHPNIVRCLDAGQVEDRPYYAMTLVEGRSLGDVLASKTPPSFSALCRGLADVAEALHALHACGLVHRDVKPSNIMVCPDGTMVLADFGLARGSELLTLTQSGARLGTPGFMSPEQLLARRADMDARTDVYGLGATLYHALTGRPPFHASSLRDLTDQVLQRRPARPRRSNAAVPLGCERMALKCLEKAPADRYPSARALAGDLRAFAEGKAVAGRPLSPLGRGLKAVRRRPVWAAGVLLLLGACAYFLLRVEPAYLSVTAYPPSRVTLDGRPLGPTPLSSVRVEPGVPHVLRLVPLDARFRSREETASFEEGTTTHVLRVLEPLDPHDWASVAVLADALGIDHPAPEVRDVSRLSGAPHDVQILGPRGKVRARDLFEVGATIAVGDSRLAYPGTIRFRRGGKTLAAISDWRPTSFVSRVEIPPSVTRAVRPGDVVELEVGDLGIDAVRAEMVVVGDDVADAALERIESIGAASDGPENAEAARRSLRALALLQHGLAYAAWAGLRPREGEEERLLCFVMEERALRALIPDWRELEGVARYWELRDRIQDDAWPREERVRVFGSGGGGHSEGDDGAR